MLQGKCCFATLVLMSKTFILGLPRTGTTSVCAALLDLGFRVCHTAYTDAAFEQADVVADTPVFAFYPELDTHFPGAKYILLGRRQNDWLDSIRSLLNRVVYRYQVNPQAFHPLFIQSMRKAFGLFVEPEKHRDLLNDEYLLACYVRHCEAVSHYFKNRQDQLLEIDLYKRDSFQKLCQFMRGSDNNESDVSRFPHLNMAGRISDWDRIRHPLKMSSHLPNRDGRRVLSLGGFN